jgi:hypothetical protein
MYIYIMLLLRIHNKTHIKYRSDSRSRSNYNLWRVGDCDNECSISLWGCCRALEKLPNSSVMEH